MAFTYPVKWITNTMRGAPQISGTAGTFIAALDAFLNTGWGSANAISVSISGGVGTALFAEGVFFEDHSVVLFANATTPAALNGEARVLSHTNNSITFETNAPDGVATTGTTITCRYAPVGNWSKPFAGVNKAAFRSTDVQASGHYLRVDDSGAATARMLGYEAMTDVDTGTGAFPTAVMASGGGYVHKSMVSSSAAVRYAMAADSRAVLWAIEPGSYNSTVNRVSNVRGFGDSIAMAPSGDVWSSFVSAAGLQASNGFDAGSLAGGAVSSGGTGSTCFPRAFSAMGSSLYATAVPFTGVSGATSGADSFAGSAPSTVDGQIKLSRVFLREQAAGSPPRCIVPGVLYVPQSGLTSLLVPTDTLSGAGEWAGRRLLAVGCGINASNVPGGIAFLDLTGPWR